MTWKGIFLSQAPASFVSRHVLELREFLQEERREVRREERGRECEKLSTGTSR